MTAGSVTAGTSAPLGSTPRPAFGRRRISVPDAGDVGKTVLNEDGRSRGSVVHRRLSGWVSRPVDKSAG